MDRLTLREAAERTYRSITTLRRYIRSGRLRAEKRFGRFGPEYFVSERDLSDAGLEVSRVPRPSESLATRTGARRELPATRQDPAHDRVPISLFQELQMKHEQLLVQYGMVRAGGMRTMELQADLQAKQSELDDSRGQVSRLHAQNQREASRLKEGLREAQLELEGRALEIAALQEKVKALEMLTRNAVTNEPIEKQFSDVMSQARRVTRLAPSQAQQPPGKPAASRPRVDPDGTDH